MEDSVNPLKSLPALPKVRLSRWLLVIPLVLGLLLIAAGLKTVEAYESCLLLRNGTIRDQWGPGLHWSFPIGSGVTCYRTARITLEASPGEAGAGADYNDDAVVARSKDGQIIDAVRAAGKELVLAKAPPAKPVNGTLDQAIQQYNMVIDELAANGTNGITVPPVDFYGYFLSRTDTHYFDTVLLNGLGYEAMAQLWLDALTP